MLSLLQKYSSFLSEYFTFSQHDLIIISSVSCPITEDQTLNISNGPFVGWSLNDQIRAYSSRSVETPVGCRQSSCSDLLSIQVEFITVNHPAWSPRSRLRKQPKLEMAALLTYSECEYPLRITTYILSVASFYLGTSRLLFAVVFVQCLKYLWIWKLES